MKKLLKMNFIICLVLTLIYSSIANSSALGNEDIQLSNIFITHVDNMFNYQDKSVVIDKNGNDMTNQFFSDNHNYFMQKNYLSIKNYMDTYVCQSSVEKNTVNNLARSPYVTQTVNKSFTSAPGGNVAGTVTYSVNGSFTWDRATGKITSIGNTTMYASASLPAFWRYEVTSISTNKSLSSDKCYATFSGTLKMKATFSPAAIPLMTANLGPFSGSVTAHPEG